MVHAPDRSSRPHVVVVGGGFGGLAATRQLRHADVDVTLVDRHPYTQFQPLLYQVATAALNPGDVTHFLRSFRSRQPNLRVVNGVVVSMDHEERTVVLDGGQAIAYDYLVIAAGATTDYLDIPGAREHAMPLYERSQALAVRDRVLARLEDAAINGQERDLRVVVVGAGPTGVETAGAFAELRNEVLPATYPELDPDRTHVTLVEAMPAVLGPFDEGLQRYARRSLERRGVDVRLSTAVKEVHPEGVVVGEDEEFLESGLVVWASGVTVDESVADWDVPQGQGGRITVDDHLRVTGRDRVFAVGDIAVHARGPGLPQLAQPAIQGGTYVGRLIRAESEGATREPFRYRDKGTMATIGRCSAVAELPVVGTLTGSPAWALWLVVHLYALLGGRNRMATMINLGARYLSQPRHHNVIVGDTPPLVMRRPKRLGAAEEPVAQQ